MAKRRHLSRIAVMLTLYQREKHVVDADAALKNIQIEAAGNEDKYYQFTDTDQPYSLNLLKNVIALEEEIKAKIQKHAPEWSLKRMDPIARCVLLIGTYELLFEENIPAAVAMNEAIEIAKEYGTEQSGKFVNGVLNAVAKSKCE